MAVVDSEDRLNLEKLSEREKYCISAGIPSSPGQPACASRILSCSGLSACS